SHVVPGHKILPYLLRNMTITRVNQVWAADITDVPMGRGFLYLVATMDWASRAVLAFPLSNTMDVSFCVSARGGGSTPWQAGNLQHRPGQPVYQPGVHRLACCCWSPKCRWTDADGGWTTCSSRGCGARSSTRTSISRATATVARQGPGIAEWINFYN